MSEAEGEECGDAITPLIWLYETSDSEGSSARKVDNGVVACFHLYQIISFISVMTHIAGEGGRVSCLLPLCYYRYVTCCLVRRIPPLFSNLLATANLFPHPRPDLSH